MAINYSDSKKVKVNVEYTFCIKCGIFSDLENVSTMGLHIFLVFRFATLSIQSMDATQLCFFSYSWHIPSAGLPYLNIILILPFIST